MFRGSSEAYSNNPLVCYTMSVAITNDLILHFYARTNLRRWHLQVRASQNCSCSDYIVRGQPSFDATGSLWTDGIRDHRIRLDHPGRNHEIHEGLVQVLSELTQSLHHGGFLVNGILGSNCSSDQADNQNAQTVENKRYRQKIFVVYF